MIAMRSAFGLDQRARAAAGLRVKPGERAGGRRKIGAGKLRRGQHGERVLHQVPAGRAEAVARSSRRECRR